jgi:hypothetical protein
VLSHGRFGSLSPLPFAAGGKKTRSSSNLPEKGGASKT